MKKEMEWVIAILIIIGALVIANIFVTIFYFSASTPQVFLEPRRGGSGGSAPPGAYGPFVEEGPSAPFECYGSEEPCFICCAGPGCSLGCAPPACGDGIINYPDFEQCDDGCNQGDPNYCEPADDGDGCSGLCNLEGICGDGTVDPLTSLTWETCDDGGVCSSGPSAGEICLKIDCNGDTICEDVYGPGDYGNDVLCEEACIIPVEGGEGACSGSGVGCTSDADCEGYDDSLCEPQPGDGCDGSCHLEGTAWCGNGGPCTSNADCELDNFVEYCVYYPGQNHGSCVEFNNEGVPLEQCDDGNLVSGDGCYNCVLELP